MKKNSLFLLLAVACSVTYFISCQKLAKNEIQNDAKLSPELSNAVSSLSITQVSPDQLVYSGETAEPIDLLSVEYNRTAKVVSSTINMGNMVPDITYSLSFNDPIWKTHQTTQIEQKAADLSSYNLPLSTIQATITNLEGIMNSVVSSASSEVLYSLSINISILKTLARKAANPADCNCTVHPSFLVGKAYFLCQEDHFYNKANLTAVLNQYETEFGQTVESGTMKQYVQNYPGVTIPFANIYGLRVSPQQFEQTLINIQNGVSARGDCAWWCPIGCGTDHGCCGNYKGCCFLRLLECYVHDKLCINCTPAWFCGPACKPGSEIPDPSDPIGPGNPDGPGNPGNNDAPLASEYVDYWNYLNSVKAWANDRSSTDPIPDVYNEGELMVKINGFSANPGSYPVPDKASDPRFIYRLRNFVTSVYFQYPGATSPDPTVPPANL